MDRGHRVELPPRRLPAARGAAGGRGCGPRRPSVRGPGDRSRVRGHVRRPDRGHPAVDHDRGPPTRHCHPLGGRDALRPRLRRGRCLPRAPHPERAANRLVSFLVGWGILRVVAIVPVVGFFALSAATIYGLGCLTVAAYHARAADRRRSASRRRLRPAPNRRSRRGPDWQGAGPVSVSCTACRLHRGIGCGVRSARPRSLW